MKMWKYYIMGLIIGICISCDDFLDQSPKYNLTLENAVTDYNGAKNVLNGIYSKMVESRTTCFVGGYLYGALSNAAGVWKHSFFDSFYNMSYKNQSYTTSVWQTHYGVINAANAAITALTNLSTDLYPSPETKEAMIGEAKCLRAWIYSDLLWLYCYWWEADDCTYGLVYRDQMANLSNLQVPRLTIGESYQKIMEDLEAAIKYMPDYTSSRTMSKQMAQLLKAKLLLYRGSMRGETQDLKDALAIVTEVKTTAPAKWAMESDLRAMYEKGWDSEEVLWAKYFGDNTNPAQYEWVYSYAVGYQNVYYDVFTDWFEHDVRYASLCDSARSPEAWDEKNVWALTKLYHKGKITEPKAPYTAYYFRYPELYLMEAELKARLDDYSVQDALAPLNEMRSKRTDPVLPPLSAASKKELLRIIFQELCLETFLENGSEYFAALRFVNDTDESAHQNKPWIYTLKPEIDFSEKQYCWPIPDDELKNNRMIEQNPELSN